uniref:Uncharacterized protein n=1 Tax=Peronospora matthiolae TaxID=2874970 RepID=A0AAV1UUZ5_9STRA
MEVSVPAEPSKLHISNASRHALLRILKKNPPVLPSEPSKLHIPNASRHALLRILKKNPPVLPSKPQIIGLKQRERSKLFSCIQPSSSQTHFPVELPRQNEHCFRSVEEMAHLLKLQLVATPDTEHCLAMAIVQSQFDSVLEGQDELVAAATAGLKRGIKYAGQLRLNEKFPHDTRVVTLNDVRRVWLGMEKVLAKKQFRWYLGGYAKSTSG